MCVQCVGAGAAYVVPAVVGLQAYRFRLRRKRLAPPPKPSTST